MVRFRGPAGAGVGCTSSRDPLGILGVRRLTLRNEFVKPLEVVVVSEVDHDLAALAACEPYLRPGAQCAAEGFLQLHDVGHGLADALGAPARSLGGQALGGAHRKPLLGHLPGQPQELYDDVYCRRGEAENRIKEQQLGLFSDRTSCHDFVANQFRVLLSAAAYILADTLRREALADTELANAQVNTIRLKLLKIGARIICSVRRIVLHLAGGYPFKDIFAHALSRLSSLCSVRLSNGFG